ncbi:MAG: hypothetical protein RLY97_970 [Pseudomonadota bacterium]
MSRYGRYLLAHSYALALILGMVNKASAQDAADEKVQAMIAAARQAYLPPKHDSRCVKSDDPGEITVCAPDKGERWRVPSDENLDVNTAEGRRNLYGDVPPAPQFDRGSCRGQPGCMIGGWAPPPVYYFDMTKLPLPPEGSDADLIAKGEMAAP